MVSIVDVAILLSRFPPWQTRNACSDRTSPTRGTATVTVPPSVPVSVPPSVPVSVPPPSLCLSLVAELGHASSGRLGGNWLCDGADRRIRADPRLRGDRGRPNGRARREGRLDRLVVPAGNRLA